MSGTQPTGVMTVETEPYEDWVERYIKAWNSNASEDIADLFTEDGRYQTEPYAEPWRGRDEIVRGWLDIKDEPGQTDFSYRVIATEGDLGVVKGEATYKDPSAKYSNLWEIRLDSGGNCTEFVEWYMKHP